MAPLNSLSNIFKRKKPQESNYLSLLVTPDRVLASIWRFENEDIRTLGFGHKEFQNADVLVHEAAIAIDTAGKLAKVDITDVVFGLSQYYLEDASLSESTTKMLKRLSQELELNPQAFVSVAAGINHLLKIEESVTPHAVLIGVFGNYCEAHLLEGSQIAVSKSFKGSVNTQKIQNLVENLKENEKHLPSRIIVFGINESSPLAGEIGKKDWKTLFVHEPKVDFLDDSELARSIAYAQAADVLGHDPSNPSQKAGALIAAEVASDSETPEKEADALGFVEGEDILLAGKKSDETAEPQDQSADEAQEESNIIVPHPKTHEEIMKSQPQDLSVENTQQEHLPPKSKKSGSLFSFLSIGFPKLPSVFKSKPGKKTIIAAVALMTLLIIALFVTGQTFTKAQVVIKVDSQSLENDFKALAQEGSQFDASKSQIGARIVSGKAQGNQKAVTTGSKTLGEKAKGEVTVFNWTSTPKSFPSQTTMINKDGLKFTLDEPLEATSASAPSGSNPGSPGKANAKITASDVGPNHNLEPGQQFTFTEFDEFSYSAQNDGTISGGSERQVTVVTQEDIDRLEDSLSKSLTEKAKEDLKNKAGSEKILDDAIVIEILNKQFDNGLDEEASLLNLDMEVEANVLVYNEEDLKKVITESFKDEAPQNLTIRAENIKIEGVSAERENGRLNLSGRFKANLLPKFDEEELKTKIGGKSIKETRAIIKELPGVTEVSVNFNPNIPILNSIPRGSDKISFKIETN